MTIKRKDNIFLPERAELKKILDAEIAYPVFDGKEKVHYPKFDTLLDLLKYLKIPDEVFTSKPPEDIYDAVETGIQLLDEIVAKSFGKNDPKLIQYFDDIYDYLSEEDKPGQADTLFIFGGKTPLRATKALEVYNTISPERIIVSGGNPIYADSQKKTEAEIYKEILVKGGVEESSIILEDKSITIPDNIRRSLALLDELKIKPNGIAIITSPYSQRRSWAVFKKYIPDSVKLIRINCDTAITRNNWYLKEDTYRIVLNEYMKMLTSVVYNNA